MSQGWSALLPHVDAVPAVIQEIYSQSDMVSNTALAIVGHCVVSAGVDAIHGRELNETFTVELR